MFIQKRKPLQLFLSILLAFSLLMGVLPASAFAVSTAAAESVQLEHDEITLAAGEDFQVKAAVLPEGAADQTVYFRTDDSAVAEVSSDGVVHARGAGSTWLEAGTKGYEKSARCLIRVTGTQSEDSSSDGDASAEQPRQESEYPAALSVIGHAVCVIEAESCQSFGGGMESQAVSAGSGHYLSGFSNGDWMRYDLDVQNSGIYEIALSVAHDGEQTEALRIELPDGSVQTLTVPQTASNEAFEEIVLADVALERGIRAIKVTSLTDGWSFDRMTVTPKELDVAYIKIGTTVSEYEASLELEEGQSVVVKRGGNGLDREDPIGTGNEIIVMKDGKEVYRNQALVRGDMDGDGVMGIRDLLMVKMVILNGGPEDIYEWMGDFEEDGNIGIRDLISMKVYILTAGETVPVESVSFENEEESLFAGESVTLIPIIQPEYASNRSVVYSIGNSSVASITQDGVVTAKRAGNTWATVRTVDGSKTAQCLIRVREPVSEVTLDRTEIELKKGAQTTLVATVLPEDAPDKSVVWSVGNAGIATVTQDGVITAKEIGNTWVTVRTAVGSKTAQCLVRVVEPDIPVSGVTLNKTQAQLEAGATLQLTATVSPADATDKSVTYQSDDASVASVSASGLITAKSAGSTTIRVTTNSGGKTAACTVQVLPSIQSITLNGSSKELALNGSFQLSATITPSNAYNPGIQYTSSNQSVATVSASGLIKARQAGSATITASAATASGTKKATFTVTIRAQSIYPNGQQIVVTASEAEVFPTDTYDDMSDGRCYPLPKGTVDYVTKEVSYVDGGQRFYYYLLASGKRVYQKDVSKVTNSKYNLNRITSFKMTASKDYTDMVLATDWKVPYNVTPDGSKVTIVFPYTGQVPANLNLTQNPMFTKATWSIQTSSDSNVRANAVLTLTLRASNGFRGFEASYTSEGLRFRFTNYAQISKNSSKPYGYDLTGMTFVIDPGHGLGDPGAIGYGGVNENTVTWQIASLVTQKLKTSGATVTQIDTKNKDVSLDERVSITKKIRPDVFLSIHANSSTVSSATGTECYYFHLFSRNMADRIASNVSSSLGLSNRNNNGNKMYPYKVLRMSSAYPSALVETAFINNSKDYLLLTNSVSQNKFADAIAKSVVQYAADTGALQSIPTGTQSSVS
ncbi:Ig-like domain-containing protein [Candidatus Soleaferrea massiliensis]|uniref:Ig-like domain-containing protein n=1 Tax=Candidatus Soleaferrea massiliensis TaxID=1470354 RepID=UPI000A9EBC6F|nr:Ig-like domain-containing protein [Candidatus Soleaferrea massiliensis]